MFLMFSELSPVNKVPAMAIDQSRPKRKRGERGQRVLDLDLGQASCGLGHLGHAWPIKAATISFLKPLHLGVLCCTTTIPSPDQLLPLVHSQANC